MCECVGGGWGGYAGDFANESVFVAITRYVCLPVCMYECEFIYMCALKVVLALFQQNAYHDNHYDDQNIISKWWPLFERR